MPDTFSPILGYTHIATSGDNNTWGDICNNQVFTIFEDAICGVYSGAVTGGTLDLSGSPPPAAASQARFAMFKFSGTLTATQLVIVPNLTKIYKVYNGTSGAFGLLFKVAGGTAVNCPAGRWTTIFCDGALGNLRDDREKVGTYVDSHANVVPNGSFACDGSLKNPADYPDLFAKLSTTFGGNGTTTFGLPNLQDTGRFRRSSTPTLAPGTTQANQIATHTHTASATTTGSTSTAGAHTHTATSTVTDNGHNHTVDIAMRSSGHVAQDTFTSNHKLNNSDHSVNTSTDYTGITVATVLDPANAHTHVVTASTSVTVNAAGSGTDMHPESIVVLTCIRY